MCKDFDEQEATCRMKAVWMSKTIAVDKEEETDKNGKRPCKILPT